MTWEWATVVCVFFFCAMIVLVTYFTNDWDKYWKHDKRLRDLEEAVAKSKSPRV